MKKILLTRPIKQSLELAQKLNQKGAITFIEPLFEVEQINFDQEIKDKFSALIITSQNAIEGLSLLNIDKETKIFTIGKKTQEKITQLGFNNVSRPEKENAKSLKDFILENSVPCKILYLHGSIISFDFVSELPDFKITKLQTYATKSHQFFSEQLIRFCQQNRFDEVMIFSKNTAQIFCNLVQSHNLLEYFSVSAILCLSEEIKNQMEKFGFPNCSILAKEVYE